MSTKVYTIKYSHALGPKTKKRSTGYLHEVIADSPAQARWEALNDSIIMYLPKLKILKVEQE